MEATHSASRGVAFSLKSTVSGSVPVAAASEAQTKKMAAAVDAEPGESLRQADTDEWAASLAHHFAVACPELKTDAVWMEPSEEIGVDVSRDPMRAIIDPYSATVRNYPVLQSRFLGMWPRCRSA